MVLKYKLSVEDRITINYVTFHLLGNQKKRDDYGAIFFFTVVFIQMVYRYFFVFNPFNLYGFVIELSLVLLFINVYNNPKFQRWRVSLYVKPKLKKRSYVLNKVYELSIDNKCLVSNYSGAMVRIKLNALNYIFEDNGLIVITDSDGIFAVIPVSIFKTTADKYGFIKSLKKT